MPGPITKNLFFYFDFAQPRMPVKLFPLRFIPGLALYTRINEFGASAEGSA